MFPKQAMAVLLATVLPAGFASAQSKQSVALPETEQKACALLAFGKELRDALTTSDVAHIALLANYPLRINDEGGSFYIHDAGSLYGHFREIFTPTVRNAILKQQLDEDCGAYKVVYGFGEAVVNLYELGYRISSINTSTNAPSKRLVGRVEFVCRTKERRMVVDNEAKDNRPRLRAWNTAKSLTQEPDMELKGGKEEIEGTFPCTHSVWTFKSGATEITLSELGCYPDSNQPPGEALGQVAQHTGKQESWSWCY